VFGDDAQLVPPRVGMRERPLRVASQLAPRVEPLEVIAGGTNT